MSSVAAYAFRGGEKKNHAKEDSTRVREIMTMGWDGARLVLDWMIPLIANDDDARPAARVLDGKVVDIARPVVLLVHGMNNDSSFGYIRSMMKTAVERGWVAVCMNLRGQDYLGVMKNTTPRGVS